MVMVKNTAKGVRFLQAKTKTGVETVALEPGQEREIEVFDAEDPVFAGMVDSGQLRVSGKSRKAAASEPGAEKRHAQNPLTVGNTEAATAAGQPGSGLVSDPNADNARAANQTPAPEHLTDADKARIAAERKAQSKKD